MKLVRVDQPPSCSFCGKSRQDAKTLIASPGHLAHICGDCTLGPSTLKTGLDEPGIEQTVTASVFESCKDCLIVCHQILTDDTKSVETRDESKTIQVRADFSGLFGELLCISHGESCFDEQGRPVTLQSGMKLTAFDEEQDDEGNKDDLIVSGTVKPAPDWLRCNGSRWVLQIDENGVRHQSELGKIR